MPPTKKRKTAAKAKGAKKDHVVTARTEPQDEETVTVPEEQPTSSEIPASPIITEQEPTVPEPAAAPSEDLISEPSSSTLPTPAPPPPAAPAIALSDRFAKLQALRNRSKASSAANLTAAQTEAHRLKHDTAQLSSLQRKSGIANVKLAKADIEDAGGDFERMRAWDYTTEQDEKWNERIKERAAHRDNNAFQDFAAEAGKVYERQLRNMGEPDLERHQKRKTADIEQAIARGTLEVVETEDGEVLAVDRHGTFSGIGGGGGRDLISSFADSKPDKQAVDRLVGEMKKNDEITAKKRRERLARNGDDGGDVTYINDKNSKSCHLSREVNAGELVLMVLCRAIQPEAVTLLQQVYRRHQGQFRAWYADLNQQMKYGRHS